MDIQYHGANCVRITTKKASIIIDDNLVELGLKSATKAGDIALYTMAHGEPKLAPKIIIDHPGEYEVSSISVTGVAARAHIDEAGAHNATIFKLVCDDVKVAVVGHVYPDLTNAQLEALGMIDILIIPVGGNGYTLDGVGALKLIKEIEPKLVIPTHYDDTAIAYPVPQQTLEQALKALGMEPQETAPKIKVKAGELSEVTQLAVLERQ